MPDQPLIHPMIFAKLSPNMTVPKAVSRMPTISHLTKFPTVRMEFTSRMPSFKVNDARLSDLPRPKDRCDCGEDVGPELEEERGHFDHPNRRASR
jgi:hypothetical protein